MPFIRETEQEQDDPKTHSYMQRTFGFRYDQFGEGDEGLGVAEHARASVEKYLNKHGTRLQHDDIGRRGRDISAIEYTSWFHIQGITAESWRRVDQCGRTANSDYRLTLTYEKRSRDAVDDIFTDLKGLTDKIREFS